MNWHMATALRIASPVRRGQPADAGHGCSSMQARASSSIGRCTSEEVIAARRMCFQPLHRDNAQAQPNDPELLPSAERGRGAGSGFGGGALVYRGQLIMFHDRSAIDQEQLKRRAGAEDRKSVV